MVAYTGPVEPNHTLVDIALSFPAVRATGGSRLRNMGRYVTNPVSQGCISPLAPVSIDYMLNLKKKHRGSKFDVNFRVNRVEELTLKEQFTQTLEEARVVLPGIQALFGFQFIAIFNSVFSDLPETDKHLHLFALSLTAMAVILAMAPAALHRQAEPSSVSDRLVRASTRFLTIGMAPLGAGIVIDFYIVLNLVLLDRFTAVAFALTLGLVLFSFWFLFPNLVRKYLKSPA